MLARLPSWPPPADRHPFTTYLSKYPPGSRAQLRKVLGKVPALLGSPLTMEAFPWPALRHQHLMAIRRTLVDQGLAPSTCNSVLSALRGIVTECWRLEYFDRETMARILDGVANVKGDRPLAGRALTAAEIARCFQSCADDPNRWRGARDAGLLVALLGCALRRAEASALDVDDYHEQSFTVRHGKGDRWREVPVPPDFARWLEWWLRARGRTPGPLFTPITCVRNGRTLTRLSAQGIYWMTLRRVRLAGIADVSPHDFRRTYASDRLDEGVDLALVARLLGHRQVQTTMRYDRRPAATLRAAVQHVRIPR